MFSNNKKSKIITITFTVIFFILIFNATFWQSYIIDQINERLSDNRFKIISAKISGNLFSIIKIKKIKVTHPTFGVLSINKSLINLDFISSIFGRLTFDYISIENLITQSLKSALNEAEPIKSIKLKKDEPFIDDTNGLLNEFIESLLYGRDLDTGVKDYLKTFFLVTACINASENNSSVNLADLYEKYSLSELSM